MIGALMVLGGFLAIFAMCCCISTIFSIFQGMFLILFSARVNQETSFFLPQASQPVIPIQTQQPIFLERPTEQPIVIPVPRSTNLLPMPEPKQRIYVRPF